jgi:ABC-type transport system involved in cytochrome bd biosynthesis fused ATPase/permease subunit
VLAAAARLGDLGAAVLGRRMPLDSEALDRLLGSACYSPARIERELGWRARVGLAERCAGRLDEELDKLQLSAGETQLLVIARILLSRRPLIVLDEATSDLSHGGMRKMAELLYRYRPEASYLVIAHHLEPLLSVDKVVVMEAGTVVEQGSPVSLLANSHSRFHQLFVGQVNRQVPQTV